MRWLVVLALTCCTDDKPQPRSFACDPPAVGPNCACFDGDVRCDPLPTCPLDLSLPCTPTEMCGDLSGGSDGLDCHCTCTEAGTWSCAGYDGECVPR